MWLLYLLGGTATLMTSPRMGRLADRIGKLKVFRIMALLFTIPMLLITHASVMPMAAFLAITTSFFILSNGRMVAGHALIAGAADPSVRSTFMGFYACAISFGMGLASFTSGHIIDTARDGTLLYFHWTGYLAVCITLLAVYFSGKVQQRGYKLGY
jgi:MFS transporter, DHA1 family, inner membrane transport protein